MEKKAVKIKKNKWRQEQGIHRIPRKEFIICSL
jgi:hypothetical protein